ncbi:unnamed protein product, partial [marine sediment metagenome]
MQVEVTLIRTEVRAKVVLVDVSKFGQVERAAR